MAHARAASGSGASSEWKTIATRFAAAKRAKEEKDAAAAADASIENGHGESGGGPGRDGSDEDSLLQARAGTLRAQQLREREALEARRRRRFEQRWMWAAGFWVWMLCVHAAGIGLFTSGFLLTRLVLDDKSTCAVSPSSDASASDPALPGTRPAIIGDWPGRGTPEGGCWHPRTFSRAVVVVVDALRYDFTVPSGGSGAAYHDAMPFLYESAAGRPQHAFLRPFIADPPTATLQRLKGLTTGTLPTFVDLGSNFAGTAIEEDNLLGQLRAAGRRIAHLGDDTWTALFPAHFEANISRAYDSFNVWDLHTVDEGVLEHIFPLMEPGRRGEWDVLVAHLLGVDHAGHRYGPAHAAMTAKLRQMDAFVRRLAGRVDDDTLLVVMGDHGMDAKGDHGGESDDEVEAALWMYSSRPVFGRTDPAAHALPPASAKDRPVGQIDLVPTLALLLGIPIPYNNLGRPIEEAFAGRGGDAFDNLAAAARVASAGIRRYQTSYAAARGGGVGGKKENKENKEEKGAGLVGSAADHLWTQAELSLAAPGASGRDGRRRSYELYLRYQAETLRACKGLWARFDVPSMALGIATMALGVAVLLLYAAVHGDDGAVVEDAELDLAERRLEMLESSASASASSDSAKPADIVVDPAAGAHKPLLLAGLAGVVPGAVGGAVLRLVVPGPAASSSWQLLVAGPALTSTAAVLLSLFSLLLRQQQQQQQQLHRPLRSILPSSGWGWLAVVVAAAQSAGFASNSYTIWEDSITLFLLATFGLAAALAALRLDRPADRALAAYHGVFFAVLARLASFSKLCREEQMPHCRSTFYASATSSTSAPWQLAVPFAVALALPSVVRAFLAPTRSYEALAPAWVGYVLRAGLAMAAVYWVLDAADGAGWPAGDALPAGTVRALAVFVARATLALAVVAGSTAFAWAPPCVSVTSRRRPPPPPPHDQRAPAVQVVVLGHANAHGARYLLLPLNVLVALVLVSKPMAGGALALMACQLLSLAELLDLLALPPSSSAVGPAALALLASFHYFKTGHQAALSTIQWDAAFVALHSVRYPWAPLLVAANHFGAFVLAAAALPLLVLWKSSPERRGLLPALGRCASLFVAYFAVESLATMACAAHLRRHLMLYRVFSPRFMMAAAVLLLVDLVLVLVALTAFRVNSLAVADVFGWPE